MKLKPFDGITHGFTIEVDVKPNLSKFHITYNIHGPIETLENTESGPLQKEPIEGLWKTTCFEFFCGPVFETHYMEWNFAASGYWGNAYLENYRKISHAHHSFVKPLEVNFQTPNKEELKVNVTLCLPNTLWAGKPLQGHCPVILDHGSGLLSYWAGKHPSGKPDFHARNFFDMKL